MSLRRPLLTHYADESCDTAGLCFADVPMAAPQLASRGGIASSPPPAKRGFGGEAVGFGKAELLAHDVRAEHHRHHLVCDMATAHALAAHPAVRRDDQPLRRDVLQRFADELNDLFRSFDLWSMTPMTIFLSLTIARTAGAGLEGDGVRIDLVERLQRRLVALDLPDLLFAHPTRPYQPSPIWPSGRPTHRPFRGLLGVHSRCGLHTRAVTNS
jgi:hypothetical protein